MQGLVHVLLSEQGTYLNEYLTTFIEHEVARVINLTFMFMLIEERLWAINQTMQNIYLQWNKMEWVRQ